VTASKARKAKVLRSMVSFTGVERGVSVLLQNGRRLLIKKKKH